MYKNRTYGGGISTRNIVIIACAAILVFLIAVAIVVAVVSHTGDMMSRDQIEQRLDELGSEDLGHDYVARHLLEYGIGGFDSGKFRRIENYFKTAYPKQMPSIGEMAYKTARLYLEFYYDRTDAEDEDIVTAALLRCYTEATGDGYAVYRNAEELEEFDVDMSGTFVGIGVSVIQTVDPVTGMLEEVYVESIIDGSGADAAGILPGDLITAVDGRSIAEFTNGSLVSAIRGEEGTTVDISVLRGEEDMVFSCRRQKVVDATVRYKIEGGIGYITVTSFKANTPDMFVEALSAVRSASVEGLVFDLRSNPGGYLDSVLSMINMLLPKGVRIASYVGADGEEVVFNSDGSGSLLGVPIVVLCNEYTASAGELFTAAIRDFNDMGLMNASIVGTSTFGKGVMQTTYTLYDGSSITLTTAFYNPPCGKNYDGVGVIPDEYVAYQSGENDNQMQKAVEVLRSMMDVDHSNSM